MRSGTLRDKLIFQVKTTTRNNFGDEVEAWADAFTLWGAFEPLGSSEFPTIAKRWQETTARFRIRYKAGIDCALHRIVLVYDLSASPVSTSTWDIKPPLPVKGRPRELYIEASEVK